MTRQSRTKPSISPKFASVPRLQRNSRPKSGWICSKASFLGLRPLRKTNRSNKLKHSRYSRSKRRLLKKNMCRLVPDRKTINHPCGRSHPFKRLDILQLSHRVRESQSKARSRRLAINPELQLFLFASGLFCQPSHASIFLSS